MDSIPDHSGTKTTWYKLMSGRNEDLDTESGVSVNSSLLLEEVISSSSSLSLFSLSSLVNRPVAMGMAAPLHLSLRVVVLALSKLWH